MECLNQPNDINLFVLEYFSIHAPEKEPKFSPKNSRERLLCASADLKPLEDQINALLTVTGGCWGLSKDIHSFFFSMQFFFLCSGDQKLHKIFRVQKKSRDKDVRRYSFGYIPIHTNDTEDNIHYKNIQDARTTF